MAFRNYLEGEDDKPYFHLNSLAHYYEKMEGFAAAVENAAKTLNLTKEEIEQRVTAYILQNKTQLDQRLGEWDEKLQQFDGSVSDLLTEWVDDGTLNHIIDTTLIDEKFAPLTAQLLGEIEVAESKIKSVSGNPTNYTGAIVTFIDDDVQSTLKTTWQTLTVEKGIKISLAALTGKVNTAGYLTKEELLVWQENGHDILSHGISGSSIGSATDADAETEFRDSQIWLKENGFKGYGHLVYSGGLAKDNFRIKNIARKYYQHGVVANLSGDPMYNSMPIDNWGIFRAKGDTSSLDFLKSVIDSAITNDGWVVVMTHSQLMTAEVRQKISDLIDYIKSKSVPILPFTEAVKLKGNSIATGEYYDPTSTFVSVKGKAKIGLVSGMTVSSSVNTNFMDDPITVYTKDYTSVRFMDSVRDTLTKVGGTMTVYRSSNHDLYSYALFTPLNSNIMYIRKWNHSKMASTKSQSTTCSFSTWLNAKPFPL